MEFKISKNDDIVLPFDRGNNKTIRLGYYRHKKPRFNPIYVIVIDDKVYFYQYDFNNELEDYYIFIDKRQLKKFHNIMKNDNYKNYKDILIKKRFRNRSIYLLTEMFNFSNEYIRYIFKSDNPSKEYIDLLKSIEKEFKFDFRIYRSIFSKTISEANYRNAKILRRKKDLDINFSRMYSNGYSDIFKMLENRDNRLIYILDVNSMYPYLLTKKIYPDPSFLQYSDNIDIDRLSNGMFRVKIYIDKDIWLNKYNSLFYRYRNSTIPLQYSVGDIIETYLSYSEVIFYRKYYKIDILEGIYSNNTIFSPLSKLIDKYYKSRNLSDGLFKSIYKTILIALPSSMNQNSMKTFKKSFNDIEDMKNYFYNKYLINIEDNIYYNNNLLQILDIKEKNSNIEVKYRVQTYKNSSNIFSIINVMYAEARVEMLKYIELFLNSNIDLDICYINIDSIHISINKKDKDIFEKFLSDNKLIGTELGKLKIEAIGNKALWLEVGNYWIEKNGEIIKFSNMLPNDRIKNPFQTKIIEQDYDQYGNIIYKKYDIFKSLRYIKEIYKDSDNNIYLNRIESYNNISSIIIKLLSKNINIYKDIFNKFKG